MIYDLQSLLSKMGAPEVREKGDISWHYFDAAKNRIAGAAEIRLEAGGERLIAELKHIRENVEDDNGKTHPVYIDNFFMAAERTARPGHYRVIRMAFDGDVYDKPKQNIVELGLGIFHARALDISLRMVEQTFNKQDILEPPVTSTHVPAKKPAAPVKPSAAASTATSSSLLRQRAPQIKRFLNQKEPGQKGVGRPSAAPAAARKPAESCVIIPFPSRKGEGRIRA